MGTMVKGYEVYGISHTESINPVINGQLKTIVVGFVNPGYWAVKGYNFIEGRAFVENDYNESRPVAVIKESNARKYFGSPAMAMNREVEFQGNIYHIIGVVEDFSVLTSNEWTGIWVPHKYNKGVPSGWVHYAIEYLFPKTMLVTEMKENVWFAVKHYFEQQDKNIIDPLEVYTNREQVSQKLGGDIFKYGIIVILLVLLIIPAVNIVTINMANTDKQAEGIAIRRALGASKTQVFFQLMSEITLLVLLGTLIGFFLSFPVSHIVETYFLDYGTGEGSKLLGKQNWWVILYGVLPVSFLFALMAGGIPAWKISRKSISMSLKGEVSDEQLMHKNSGFTGIYIEQALVFITLMLCTVSVLKKIEIYKTPGMLDTSNTLIFGYSASSQHEKFNWNDVVNALKQVKIITEDLRKNPTVEAISKVTNLLPYGATIADGLFCSLKADGKEIEVIDLMTADPDTYKVLKPILDEGQWFSDDDNNNSSYTPAIITRQLADSIGWIEAIGRKISLPLSDDFSIETQVIGVIKGLKKDVFEESKIGIIIPTSFFAQMGMTASSYYCVRLTSNEEKDNFSNEYYNMYKKRIGTNTAVEAMVSDMDRYKTEQIIKSTSGLIAQSVPTVFFLIFGFIGSLGLFWLYTEKRKSEYALRRALGATKMQLMTMVLTKSLILTLLGSVPGIILAFFIYDFRKIEFIGIGLTLLIMILFSVFSTWYPAYKSSQLSPAESLHYN
jgi:ABC-type antimicrobial peptide transport system permease subunit